MSIQDSIAELDQCMDTLLTSLTANPQQTTDSDPLAGLYPIATKLKDHYLALLKDNPNNTAASLQHEIEELKHELKEKDDLLQRYALFVENWKARLDELKLTHRVNMNDFRKR